MELDFNDPSWKQKFQEDWNDRFNLPHISDTYDLKPRPTTFSLKKTRFCAPSLLCHLCISYAAFLIQRSLSPMDMWNDYVDNDTKIQHDTERLGCQFYISHVMPLQPSLSWVRLFTTPVQKI